MNRLNDYTKLISLSGGDEITLKELLVEALKKTKPRTYFNSNVNQLIPEDKDKGEKIVTDIKSLSPDDAKDFLQKALGALTTPAGPGAPPAPPGLKLPATPAAPVAPAASVCKFKVGDRVIVKGRVEVFETFPLPAGATTKIETVNEVGVVFKVNEVTPMAGTTVCVYIIKFNEKRYGGIEDEEMLRSVEDEFYVSGDVDINLFKVALYKTVNGRDQFVGQSTCSRNDTIKSVLNAFKQVCMRCIVSSGKMFVTSLDPKDLYVSFSNLNLKYDQVELYLL